MEKDQSGRCKEAIANYALLVAASLAIVGSGINFFQEAAEQDPMQIGLAGAGFIASLLAAGIVIDGMESNSDSSG